MRAYRVSKKSESTLEEKLSMIDEYDVGDLLYVIREFEDAPRGFEPEVIKKVSERLAEKGILLF